MLPLPDDGDYDYDSEIDLENYDRPITPPRSSGIRVLTLKEMEERFPLSSTPNPNSNHCRCGRRRSSTTEPIKLKIQVQEIFSDVGIPLPELLPMMPTNMRFSKITSETKKDSDQEDPEKAGLGKNVQRFIFLKVIREKRNQPFPIEVSAPPELSPEGRNVVAKHIAHLNSNPSEHLSEYKKSSTN